MNSRIHPRRYGVCSTTLRRTAIGPRFSASFAVAAAAKRKPHADGAVLAGEPAWDGEGYEKGALVRLSVGFQNSGTQVMAKSYYSIALNYPARDVWAVIRLFDHYGWAGIESDTVIEDGKSGDQVSAIRRFNVGEKTIRQILLAHSDLDRAYTYAFCDPAPFPVRNYMATIRVLAIVESNTALVEWWATFDCAAEEYDRWVSHFEKEGFARWLSALRSFMDRKAAAQ